MISSNQMPNFNLKVVVQETGLKPDTLRAWERRYKLPTPQRTSGGHRLYSQRDIDTLKWLVSRQKEGLSISRAVELWRQLENKEQDPLQPSGWSPASISPFGVTPAVGKAIAELRQAWVAACIDFNEQQAEFILTQAFALYSPEIVALELLAPGLSEIGQGWYRGEITVQQEHFASALATRRLEGLISAAPAPTRLERILVGCPPNEEHVFSPLLITMLLRRQGWKVVYLGSNVPLAHLETTIKTTKSNLVIFSAQLLPTVASLLDVARLLKQQQTPLAYGGRMFNLFPQLQSRIPGYFLGERLEQIPQVVEQLLNSPLALPVANAASEACRQALAAYRENRPLIEAEVWQLLENSDIPQDYLAAVNIHFSSYIMAALKLGNMDYLNADIDWMQGLVSNYNLSHRMTHQYLDFYYQRCHAHLNGRGKPIIDWLETLLAKTNETSKTGETI